MKIFVGDTRSSKRIPFLQENAIGRMLVDRKVNLYPGEIWAWDNGAYRDWQSGCNMRGPDYESLILSRIERVYDLGKPYLAVLPDLVGKGNESLEYSLSWFDKLPEEWPWYLALQDGMDPGLVIGAIGTCPIQGFFLGGTDEFKKEAELWCIRAHHLKLYFHYGRAGTLGKIIHAKMIGADSLDSSFPLWSMERFRSFGKIIQHDVFDFN